jgi:aromatic ring-opening dioxygenase LigB subunit
MNPKYTLLNQWCIKLIVMKNHCINKTYSVQDDLTEPVVKHEKVDFFIVLINLDSGFDRRKHLFFRCEKGSVYKGTKRRISNEKT